jgi:hypothetical protein
MHDDSAALAPDIEETVETDVGVHLVFRVALDWETEREQAVAQMERKVAALQEYAASPAYRERFGQRPAVLRMRTPRPPPSVVEVVMTEAGVEVEVMVRPLPEKEVRCAICGRQGLEEQKVLMTSHGWACPSCFRAWQLFGERQAPRPAAGERATKTIRRRLPLVVVLLALVLLIIGGYLKLRQWQEVKRQLLLPWKSAPGAS